MSRPRAVSLGLALMAIVFSVHTHTAFGIELPQGYHYQIYADEINMPRSLEFDSQGYLYVTHDQISSGRIYRIAPDGLSTTLFGPSLYDPDSLAIDAYDHIFLGSGSGILYRISPQEDIEAIESSLLGNICALTLDRQGRWGSPSTLFVANAQWSHDLVTMDGDLIQDFLDSALFEIPYSMVFDDTGNLYIVEYSEDNPGLYRIDLDQEITQLASFPAPVSLAYNSYLGKLYVGDIQDDAIYTVTLDGAVSTFAQDITAYGLTFGPNGNLYVSERSSSPSRILKMTGFPHPLNVALDLSPDVIQVTTDSHAVTEPNTVSLTANMEFPHSYDMATIDVNTVALSVHGQALASAESPMIEGKILTVQFSLTLDHMSDILGLAIETLNGQSCENQINVTSLASLSVTSDLKVFEVSGSFETGGGFAGTDALHITDANQSTNTE